MTTIELTPRDYRTRLGRMLELAMKGEEVFFKNAEQSFVLTPSPVEVVEDDEEDDGISANDFFTPEDLAYFDQMVDDYHAGKIKPAAILRTHEDIDNYFDAIWKSTR